MANISNLNKKRIVTLLGSILTALSSGTNYVYSAYAPQLAARLHITYTQLNIIGLSGNMGVYTTGPILGRIVDKRGPKPLLIASFLLLLVGYSGLWRNYNAGPSTDDHLPFSTLLALSIFSYMTGAGGNCGLTASVNTTAKSFPEYMRATTVGVVLSGFGLSAFYFGAWSNWLFPGDTSSFLLFLALGTSLPVVIGFFTVRPVLAPEHQDERNQNGTRNHDATVQDERHLSSLSHLLGDPDVDNEGDEGAVTTYTTVEAIAAYPEAVSAVEISHTSGQRRSLELSVPRSPSVHQRSRSRHSPGAQSNKTSLPLLEPIDVNGRKLLSGWEFWLLFMILTLLSGTGLMFINNVGSIAQALSAKGNPDYDRVEAGKLQAAQVSLISLANCAGRIGVGAGADVVKTRLSGHRSYLLILISLLFLFSQIITSHVEDTKHLWNASLVLGMGYGGIFGLMPTVTLEWFGLGHFSENWGFVSLAPLIGGNVFSILFGRDFDSHVPVERSDPNPSNSTIVADASLVRTLLNPRAGGIEEPGKRLCLEGRTCYVGTLRITTIACMAALVLSFVAAWRDWRKNRGGGKARYERLSGGDDEVIWDAERD